MSDRFFYKHLMLSAAICISVISLTGCVPDTPPPVAQAVAPPIKATGPTVQISATPSTINAGDQITLSWHTVGAFSVSIEGIGPVASSGVKTVSPPATTVYHLIAKGDGGLAEASASVTISQPNGKKSATGKKPQSAGRGHAESKPQLALATPVAVAPPVLERLPVAQAPPVVDQVPFSGTMTPEEEFKANVLDVYFDYDSYDVRQEDSDTLARNAAYLNSRPNINITVGGFCDERGSNEYNLALGQNRAHSTKNSLISLGIAASRIRVVSYGKEKSYCAISNEDCWQKNRRVSFSIDQ